MSTGPDQLKLVSNFQRWKPWLIGTAVVVITALLVHTLREFLAELSYADLVAAIRATDKTSLLYAVLATGVSFLALTGYDASSLRYVGAQVGYRVAAETSFIAYALGNTVGLGVLTGGAVRMRLYGAAGVEAGTISRAIAFNALAFMLGISVVGAAALSWGASSVAPALHLPPWLLRLCAALVLLGALTSVIALYYYLMVARQVYIADPADTRRLTVAPALGLALAICVIGTLVIGIYPRPWVALGEQAAVALRPSPSPQTVRAISGP